MVAVAIMQSNSTNSTQLNNSNIAAASGTTTSPRHNNAAQHSHQTIENFSLILSNLKPNSMNLISSTLQSQQQILLQANSSSSSSSSGNASEVISCYKSKFKTIKIFIASNKYEFEAESEHLLKESQPELQEEFLQYGYDLQFFDVNLNLNYDAYKDPYCFQHLIREVEDCAAVSEAVVFIALVGNRYGDVPLPLELNQNDFQSIRTAAKDSDRDVSLLETWYMFDENSAPPVYRLKPVSETFKNLHNRSKDTYDNSKEECEIWEDIYARLIDIIHYGITESSTHKDFKPNQSTKSKQERYQLSALEILTTLAMKYSSNECLAVYRNIDGLNEKSKNSKHFIDVSPLNNKLEKFKQEKLNKFHETLWNKLNDDNKHRFNLTWNNDVITTNTSSTASDEHNGNDQQAINGENTSSEEYNELTIAAAPISSKVTKLCVQQSELRSYLQSFNEVIVTKVRNLIEKRINNENTFDVNSFENAVYQEATRHLYKFQRLNEKTLFGLDEMHERVKKLINYGVKNEHYPLFIYGSMASGKTATLTKFGNIAYNLIGVRSCLTVVRYFDLTSQCSTFEGLLYSICEQLTILQKLNPETEMPKKDCNELTQYFHKIIGLLAKGQKQVLLLIDGIQDVFVDKSLLGKANIINNHLEWLFTMLPPKVHLIVSIRKQATNVQKIEIDAAKQAAASTPCVSPLTLVPPSTAVSLITHYFEERLSNVKENYLFELVNYIKASDLKEFNAYLRAELSKCGRTINDEQIQVINDCLNIKTTTTQETLTPVQTSSSFILTNMNTSETSMQLYLHFLIKNLQRNQNIKAFLSSDNLPKDIDSLIKHTIERIENMFNPRIVSYLFNYLTAAHNGLTEMELIDILSCNSDFFFDYYTHLRLPSNLRFPIGLWVLIKHELGDLICQKYMDNKITYCWSYECIKKVMKQTYFNKVETIRACHKDIANYFLESFVETKPLVDMSRNMQIRDEEGKRFVCQQPLLYSEFMYNLRRLNELWYHLMNSGDIQRLKEHAFFNFEYLLAKCHGISLQNLLNDVDCVLKRILDTDILLLNALLRKSINILSNDPLKLASEILLKLRPLQEEYGTYVKGLVAQAIEWCDNHPSPLLIPLSSWQESPENLLITKIDNPDGILKVAVTSFNQHVFFSTNKHEICMYHVPSKKLVKKFVGHTDTINSLQISYNNRFLLSTSSDQLVKLWNLGTGDVENTFTCNKSPVLCSVLTHSDDMIITGCKNRCINFIRIDTGELVNTLDKHEDAVTSVAVSLDDTILISASLDKTIKRWLLTDMELIDTISSIFSPVTNMVMTCDNIFVVAGCANSTVQVKSVITGSDVHDLSGHNSTVTSLAVSNDCQNLFVGCSDSKLYLYDIRSKELIAVFMEQDSSINDLKISCDGSFLFSASGNSLYVFNLKKQNLKARKTEASQTLLKCFQISREGDVAITGDESGYVKLWNLVVGEMTETIMEHQKASTCVILSHSYLFSVSAFNDGIIQVYDNEIGEIISEFREHTAPIRHLYILEDNHKILSSDEENHIKVWWANTGELIDSIHVPCQMLLSSSDGKYVVSGSGDNTLKIWHLSDAKVVRQIDHPDKITTMIFTQDSNHIITGGEDNSCKIWESSTGKLIQVLIEHDGGITSIAVPNPSNYVVSGSKDKQVIFWSFKDGSVIHKLNGHNDIIVKVAITSDATVVFSASRDGVINIWSALNGKLLNGINTQYSIVDMLVASNGSRITARFADCSDIPIFSLNNKPVLNMDTKALSQMNLKLAEINDKKLPKLLPLKPKPLLYPKQTTVFRLSRSSFLNKNRKASNATDIIQNEPLSVSYNNGGGKDFFKRKTKRRKDNRSNDFSSTLSIVPNGDDKHKKTKICCLL